MCGFGFGFSGGLGGSPWIIVMMLVRLLIYAGIIFVAVRFIKEHIFGNNGSIKILNEKYARGEINEEEYLKRKNILSQK